MATQNITTSLNSTGTALGNSTSEYSAAYLDASRASVGYSMLALPIPINIFITSLRVWARLHPHSGARLAWDDYFVIFSTICAVAMSITGLVAEVPHGLGRHRAALTPEDLKEFLLGNYIWNHFYNVALYTSKLSVLALYHRIFSTAKFRQIVLYTAAGLSVVLASQEIALGFGCRPISAWWFATDGKCINKVLFGYVYVSINMAVILWIFALPIPIIMRLQTTNHKRMSLILLFSLGMAIVIIAAARMSVMLSLKSIDFTWEEIPLTSLSAWEPCSLIICANLPLVYRTLAKMMSRATGSTRSRTGATSKEQTGATSGLRASKHPVTVVSVIRRPSMSTDTESLKPSGGIMVQHEIHQDTSSHHNFEMEELSSQDTK